MNDQEEGKPYLSLSPSFRTDLISAVDHDHDSNPNEESDGEFEFLINAAGPLTDVADEVFSNCRILPVYPVFNRNLLLDSDPHPNLDQMQSLFISDPVDFRSGSISSTSSSDSVEVEGSYCKSTPKSEPQSPERRWKSASTGSGSGWRIRDFVGGRRSLSDGKEKLRLFKHADSDLKADSGLKPNTKPKVDDKRKGKKKEVKEMDMVTAHRLFYGKEKKEERKSFLPYRVGLFSNSRAPQFHLF